jgi:hypothetical protein
VQIFVANFDWRQILKKIEKSGTQLRLVSET